MTYANINSIRRSDSLMSRCSAGVAAEASSSGVGDTSVVPGWVSLRSWDLAATPGWADAWASAEAANIEDPGADEGVITDQMILSRIQPLLVEHPLDELLPPPVIP